MRSVTWSVTNPGASRENSDPQHGLLRYIMQQWSALFPLIEVLPLDWREGTMLPPYSLDLVPLSERVG